MAKTGGDKEAKKTFDVLTVYKNHLLSGKSARTAPVAEEDKEYIADIWLLTAKPVMYVCNVDEGSVSTGNAYVERVKAAVKEENAEVLIISAQIEAEIAELESYEERQMFLNDLGLTESGVNKLIKAAYRLLNLATYFTAGVQEVRAWTITQGFTAPQAAGVIHTDFEKGFIRAEVIKYEDFVKFNGSEAIIKENGKLGVEGKTYIVQDGDIMHFRFNV
jgi:GTP-binding protein YchF